MKHLSLAVWNEPPWRGPVFNELAAKLAAHLASAVAGIEAEGLVVSEDDRQLSILLAQPEVCAALRGIDPTAQGLPRILERLNLAEET